MKALIDTNAALDILQKREPFVLDALNLFALQEAGQLDLYLSSDAVSAIFTIVSKDTGRANAHKVIDALMEYVHIVPFGDDAVRRANASGIDDLEDALVVEAALAARIDVLVTRDAKRFKGASIPVMTPAELAAVLM